MEHSVIQSKSTNKQESIPFHQIEWRNISSVFWWGCKIFLSQVSSTITLVSTGFDDWHHAPFVKAHIDSNNYMNLMLIYLTRKHGQMLTSKFETQSKITSARVIAVISILTEGSAWLLREMKHLAHETMGTVLDCWN